MGNERCERVDNITNAALIGHRAVYNNPNTVKDEIFYYIYSILRSPEYRNLFASDLKKSLPCIPKVQNFYGFVEAGRKSTDLHLNHKKVEPYGGILEEVKPRSLEIPLRELYRVTKMEFPRVKGKVGRSTIIYNTWITLPNIPEEAYRYQLGARSAIEWIIDRCQFKTDKASGIVNDPNDWADNPRYIIDLLKRIVTDGHGPRDIAVPQQALGRKIAVKEAL